MYAVVGCFWAWSLFETERRYRCQAHCSSLFCCSRTHAHCQPAPDEASYVVNRLRDKGILVGTEGPHHNVIKVRPPLCFSQQDADYMVECLDAILKEDGLLHA